MCLSEEMGGGERKAINPSHQSKLVVPLVLAIILDGVPEPIVHRAGYTGRRQRQHRYAGCRVHFQSARIYSGHNRNASQWVGQEKDISALVVDCRGVCVCVCCQLRLAVQFACHEVSLSQRICGERHSNDAREYDDA